MVVGATALVLETTLLLGDAGVALMTTVLVMVGKGVATTDVLDELLTETGVLEGLLTETGTLDGMLTTTGMVDALVITAGVLDGVLTTIGTLEELLTTTAELGDERAELRADDELLFGWIEIDAAGVVLPVAEVL